MARDWRDDFADAKEIRKRAKGVSNSSLRRGLQREADERIKRAFKKLQRQRKTRVPKAGSGSGSGVEGLRVRG